MFGAQKAPAGSLLAPLRRLVARAAARDLRVLVVPGPELALLAGLDLGAVGLKLSPGPRQANVLLLIGPLSAALKDAATVAYAQMPRPRAILSLALDEIAPLPVADASQALSQGGLQKAVDILRTSFATGAFAADVTEFDAPALQSRIEYSCPMHPEVISDKPGSCPKCGMFLVPAEKGAASHDKASSSAAAALSTAAPSATKSAPAHDLPAGEYSCPMHPEVTSNQPGSCPKCGMNLVQAEDGAAMDDEHHHGQPATTEYSCPMHPEVTSNEPGSCPKCGMNLVQAEDGAAKDDGDNHGHDHGHTAAPEYSCPMHPEVTSNEPGSCPKCGMNLVRAEDGAAKDDAHHHGHDHGHPAAEYSCPMHPEVTSNEPGSCPKCGMNLVQAEDGEAKDDEHHHGHTAAPEYSCPMHPEVTSNEPGSCPKCGMNLVRAEDGAAKDDAHHHGHDHGHDHGQKEPPDDGIEPGFMSMIEMTQGTPRSSDGLQMEWITVPFGPFFPGLPGGLTLNLTLDGDTVAEAHAGSLAGNGDLLAHGPVAAADFVNALGQQMRLAPVAYRLLACRAIESAAAIPAGAQLETTRASALEHERIANHLLTLIQLGRQLGLPGTEARLRNLYLAFRTASGSGIDSLKPHIQALIAKLRRTPFLIRRLAGIGRLGADDIWSGPKSGGDNAPGDAAARLVARLDEIEASLSIITQTNAAAARPGIADIGSASGTARAEVATPRGPAYLDLTLAVGRVVAAKLDTPSQRHLALVTPITAQAEIADALVAVASLDLSPWEIAP